MHDLRVQIQTALSAITGLDCGVAIPDGMVEEGKTYFGYELQETQVGSDFNKNYTMEVSLTGRLVRKEKSSENTLQIIDTALESIKTALKGLNFKYSYNDISDYSDGFRKILVTARVRYNELNDEFIV